MHAFARMRSEEHRAPKRLSGSRAWEKKGARVDTSTPSGPTILRKSSCGCAGDCPACATRPGGMKVSRPRDPAEIEADQVANRILQGPAPTAKPTLSAKGSIGTLQRKCDTCEEEAQTIHRKPLPSSATAASQGPGHVREAVAGGGRPLDGETRGFFEPRLGYDLGAVRVHSGQRAGASAQALGAQAYTLGNDIVFNKGKFRPDSQSGKHLLAHELAHVVQQQTGAHAKAIQKTDDATFEAGTGLDKGIKGGTLVKDAAVDGQTFSGGCGAKACDINFKFTKGYKGEYPYAAAAGKLVRGVYVKIEASLKDKKTCGTCNPLRLIQVTRDFKRNAAGGEETQKPSSATRESRGGWADPKAPSRGWYVDTTDASKSAFFSDLPHTAQAGDETKPAILWDPPGFWTDDTNKGGDFFTCAVCQDAAGKRSIIACVRWGHFNDSGGGVKFNPATPVATCGTNQTVTDATTRWDNIAGNTPTGIK